jgi:hypothetical protein
LESTHPRNSWVHGMVAHQHTEEPHRHTEHIILYPAFHPALHALPLLSAGWNTCLPQSLIQMPTQSLYTHFILELQKAIKTDVVVIATAGGGNTTISGLRQSQHLSIRSCSHNMFYICNGKTTGAALVAQTAVYEGKRLGDSMLCNAMYCESISWCPTLADNREVLEHHCAGKHHLVHIIWGMHKEDLGRGTPKQQHTLDISRSN